MIKKNQRLLNLINLLTDGLLIFAAMPVAFWLRFFVMDNGVVSVPLSTYLWQGAVLTAVHVAVFAFFGLYRSFRRMAIARELGRLCLACGIVMGVYLSALFLFGDAYTSRMVLALYGIVGVVAIGAKRVMLRLILRRLRKKGYNRKHVIVLGCGTMARRYAETVKHQREMGYNVLGYVSEEKAQWDDAEWLGTFAQLSVILDRVLPDEVISAIEPQDYARTPAIIAECEKAGVKLSIIPFYAEYMHSSTQIDDLDGIVLMNIRRVPLDNLFHAFCKRTMDILCAGIMLLVLSPVMLVCAVGVKLSSPGPVIFRQQRVGRYKKNFTMYKFRSMRMNDAQDTAWSRNSDPRRTAFGSFLRKCSLDELPQLVNVLKGEMSLVGPRPEIPKFVEQFKEEIPLYMLKHQVRPGITGWAQVKDLRGDTSIADRIRHDLYYIENWSLLFDLKILFMTVFGGKFMNDEKMK